MRRSALLPLLGLALCAAPAAAQGPDRMPGHPGPMPGGPGMMMMRDGPGPDPASMLLAATGRLHLTDAQVVRLAAIARRAEERHAAMRTRMQAEHAPRPGAGDRQAPSEADMQRMHQQMEQMHQQMQTDLRDALAVLTLDQQATAFEMVAHHAGVGGPGNGGPRRRMRPGGHGGPGGPGADMMRHPDGPPLPPTIAEVHAAMTTLNQAMQKINEGNGTMGRLIADPALYEETQRAVDTLHRLLADIQQNPAKYIGQLQ